MFKNDFSKRESQSTNTAWVKASGVKSNSLYLKFKSEFIHGTAQRCSGQYCHLSVVLAGVCIFFYMSVWIFSSHSRLLPQLKDIHIGLLRNFPEGVSKWCVWWTGDLYGDVVLLGLLHTPPPWPKTGMSRLTLPFPVDGWVEMYT